MPRLVWLLTLAIMLALFGFIMPLPSESATFPATLLDERISRYEALWRSSIALMRDLHIKYVVFVYRDVRVA
jgi:hypothetical protein